MPERYLDQPLLLTAQNDRFALQGPKGEALVSGEVGKPASAGEGDEHLEIFVQELRAKPGTQFRVTSRRRAAVIDDLQTELRISEKGKKTGVLTVALDGKDPKKIASILDAIGQTYLKQNIERKSAEAAKTLEFVQGQLPDVRKNVAVAEANMKTYQVERKSVDLTAETEALLERAVEIDKALSELNMSRAEMRQRFTDSHPVLLSIKEKEDKLHAERAVLATIDFAMAAEAESFDTPELRANVDRFLGR